MARIYVIYGQGGIVTSYGMYLLANRIRKQWPAAVVTTHDWNNPGAIAADMAKSVSPIILIGYSLGANCVTWAADAFKGPVGLAVCYDPSVLSIVTNPTANVKRLLLYHNTDIEPEGHAVFVGPQVETTQISMEHLTICYSETLHQKTLAAIGLVIPKS
jgi:hypothetical protein